jgi:hypothetical protein
MIARAVHLDRLRWSERWPYFCKANTLHGRTFKTLSFDWPLFTEPPLQSVLVR